MFALNIVTWNITGIMSGAAFLSNVLCEDNIDIFELWLLPDNVHFIDTLYYNHYNVCCYVQHSLSSRVIGKSGVLLFGKRNIKIRLHTFLLTVTIFVGYNSHLPNTFMFFRFISPVLTILTRNAMTI